jgi:hypothetical protein
VIAQAVIVGCAIVVLAVMLGLAYRVVRQGRDRRSLVLTDLHGQAIEVGVVAPRGGVEAVAGRLDSAGIRHGFVMVGGKRIRTKRIRYVVFDTSEWMF